MIILYSTGCPKCDILKKKLKEANIQYTEVNDTDIMVSKGIDTLPVLEVDDVVMSFTTAVEWIKNR